MLCFVLFSFIVLVDKTSNAHCLNIIAIVDYFLIRFSRWRPLMLKFNTKYIYSSTKIKTKNNNDNINYMDKKIQRKLALLNKSVRTPHFIQTIAILSSKMISVINITLKPMNIDFSCNVNTK